MPILILKNLIFLTMMECFKMSDELVDVNVNIDITILQMLTFTFLYNSRQGFLVSDMNIGPPSNYQLQSPPSK